MVYDGRAGLKRTFLYLDRSCQNSDIIIHECHPTLAAVHVFIIPPTHNTWAARGVEYFGTFWHLNLI